MLFITALAWLGWGHLASTIPWPLLCLLTVAIVFACGVTLTSVLARTPLAVPLTGRKQQPWSTLLPRRRAPDQIYPERARIASRARTDQATGHRLGGRRLRSATRTECDSDSGMDRSRCGPPGRRAVP